MHASAREPRPAEPAAIRLARNVDVLVLALALPLFLAAGLPLAGYAAGAGAWIAQRAVKAVTERRATATDDLRNKMALIVGGMIGRGWIAAGAVFGVGVAAGDDAGLSAALLFLATFTLWFTVRLFLRPFTPPEARR